MSVSFVALGALTEDYRQTQHAAFCSVKLLWNQW